MFELIRKITPFLLILIISCGSSGSSTSEGDGGGSAGGGGDGGSGGGGAETMNSEKLVGTPFEGLTTGDDFGWSDFRTDEYLTFRVDEVPIPVFLAFFTDSEETEIELGIDMLNEGAEFEVYETTDEWSNDNRVIYKVDAIGDAEMGFGEEFFTENPAITMASLLRFNEHTFSETVACDWMIELRDDGIDRWTVAHELGHTMGIDHSLINYEEDDIEDLEADSIMQADVFPDVPQMTDYNFMMRMQGEILLDHLGEGSPPPGWEE